MILVYIAEAHAEDEWPISSARDSPSGKPVRIHQHRCLAERVAAARVFCRAFGWGGVDCRVFAAAMDGEFERSYSPWPMRLFVLMNGNVEFLTGDEFEDTWLPRLSSALANVSRQVP